MFLLLLLCAHAVLGDHFIRILPSGMERSMRQCHDRGILDCKKVDVDIRTLLSSNALHLPIDKPLTMTRSVAATRRSSYDGSISMTFDNAEEQLQGVFVQGETEGQVWAAGSVNWAKAGRHFQLETCAPEGNEKTCYVWKEMDPNHWAATGEKYVEIPNERRKNTTHDEERLLAQGRADFTTNAAVTAMVYVSPQTKAYYGTAAALTAFINQVFAETNQGYANSQIPVTLAIHCIKDSTVQSENSFSNMISKFAASAASYSSLRMSADIALLFVEPGDSCGIAYQNAISGGLTIAVLGRGCATGYYSPGHEIGHLYGCFHNREDGQNTAYPTAYAFLINPPVNSGLRTILAYTDPNYSKRINYYSSSSPTVRFNGIATGNINNDNQALIIQRRFLMSAVGNEATACPSTTPVAGAWGNWAAWTTCTATCGGGSQARTRLCNTPAPIYGGANCIGDGAQFQACNTQACSTVG